MSDEIPDAQLPKINLDGINLPGYLEIRERVVDLREVPERGQVVLALRAFGLSLPHIAGLCRCSVSTVRQYLKRYDPDGACTITEEGRRTITSSMLMSGAISALMYITPAKMKLSSASDLASVAQKFVMTAEKIRELDKASKDGKQKMQQALSVLDCEIVDKE